MKCGIVADCEVWRLHPLSAFDATYFYVAIRCAYLASVIVATLAISTIVHIPTARAQRSNDPNEAVTIPPRLDHWCPATPLAPYGERELSPGDISRKIVEPSWIVNAPVLAISFDYPSDECGEQCRHLVSTALAESLNSWRHLCLRCNPGLFALLVDDEFVYLEETMYGPLSDRNRSLSARLLNAHKALLSLDNRRPAPNGQIIGSYVRINRNNPIVSDLCTRNLGAFGSMWPGLFQSAACPPPNKASDKLPHLKVTFTRGPVCGTNADLACGTPASRIDITLLRASYVVRGPSTGPSKMTLAVHVLGNPRAAEKDKYDLTSVFLHEVGHFLGIDHFNPAQQPAKFPAALLGIYRDDFCLSPTEIMMMNSRADQTWPYALKVQHGLRRRR
jgi:hypothetical protein